MAEEKFKLPISSYAELIKIIKGYSSFNKEVAPKELTANTGMHETGISGNTGFLAMIGVLTEGRKKMLTESGRRLSNALNHELEDKISSEWRIIIQGTEFLQKMVSAIRIRNGMEIGNFRSHIAFSAGQPKKGYIMAGAGAVIEILKIAGFINDEDGKLLPTTMTDITLTKAEDLVKDETALPSTIISQSNTIRESRIAKQDSNINISIQIQIQCKADEIGELGVSVKNLVKDLNKISDLDDDELKGASKS
jgi:HAMP domain-containing protein